MSDPRNLIAMARRVANDTSAILSSGEIHDFADALEKTLAIAAAWKIDAERAMRERDAALVRVASDEQAIRDNMVAIIEGGKRELAALVRAEKAEHELIEAQVRAEKAERDKNTEWLSEMVRRAERERNEAQAQAAAMLDRVKALEDVVSTLRIISKYPCITSLLGREVEDDNPCACAACIARHVLATLDARQTVKKEKG